MNGHFEVNESSYPISGLYVSKDQYKVTDMRNLHSLHSQPISKELAGSVALQTNAAIRTGGLNLNDEDAVKEFVSTLIEDSVQ